MPSGPKAQKRKPWTSWKAWQEKFRPRTRNHDGDAPDLRNRALQIEPNDLIQFNDEEQLREKMRYTLECPICTDIFLDPVNLLCGHTFCLHCLAHDYKRAEHRLVCSICRDDATRHVVVSRTLREVVAGAFSEEERHRRETLTPSDRQALSKLMEDQQKSVETLKTENMLKNAKWYGVVFIVFLIWFFCMG